MANNIAGLYTINFLLSVLSTIPWNITRSLPEYTTRIVIHVAMTGPVTCTGVVIYTVIKP